MHLIYNFVSPVMVSADLVWSEMEAVFFCVLWVRGGSCFGAGGVRTGPKKC